MLDRSLLAPAGMPGYFGRYGGRFVPEVLVAAVDELAAAYDAASADDAFRSELQHVLATYSGRPTPLYLASRLTVAAGGARLYLKREDLSHTGSHKINNALGQALLARRMGKRRLIAETGAGQHGVATATAAAMLGLDAVVYMGGADIERQRENVRTMSLLGAEVRPVESGSRTLKDAINEALRDWATNVADSYYLLGSALGPDPYPRMVRDFQRVIGDEAVKQIVDAEGALPRAVVACVGGGSNAIGIFTAFLRHEAVALIGVEAGGGGSAPGEHAARFSSGGSPGVLHGALTYLLQDEAGQILSTSSIAAGLDYPAVGPEHAFLRELGRAQYTSVTDQEAVAAFHQLARTEGILPALESAHAVAYALKLAPRFAADEAIIVNLSGRGTKDLMRADLERGEQRQ